MVSTVLIWLCRRVGDTRRRLTGADGVAAVVSLRCCGSTEVWWVVSCDVGEGSDVFGWQRAETALRCGLCKRSSAEGGYGGNGSSGKGDVFGWLWRFQRG